MRKLTLFLCFVALTTTFWAQQPLFLNIVPKTQHQELFLNDAVKDIHGKVMQVEYFNYYLSDLQITHDGGQLLDLSDTVFILYADNHQLDLGMQQVTTVESVSFAVGVPATLNHEDIAQYPEKHPLTYQTPSMHWGWTDGYMFMIVGGMADADGDDQAEAGFQVHSFGDANYFHTSLAVGNQSLANGGSEIRLDCNLDQWLSPFEMGTIGIKHGQIDENATVMKNITKLPVFTSEQSAGLSQLQNKGQVSAWRNGMDLHLNWSDLAGIEQIRISDAMGREIKTVISTEATDQLVLNTTAQGICLIQIFDRDGKMMHQLKTL